MEKMEAMPKAFMKDPVFRKLGEVARVAALDNKDRREYERSLKMYRDNYAIFTTEHREGFAEGKAEGFAEGKAEGLAEGKAEGLAEGKAEGLAEGKAEGLAEGKAIMIKKMNSSGMTISEIAAITGYLPEEIESIITA